MDELDNLRKEILRNENFCFHPFLEVSTRPNGVILPCCYWAEHLHLSKEEKVSADKSIDYFWNSKKFIEIRNDMYAGKEIRGCKVCTRDKAASMRARSIRENINNREYLQLVSDTIKNGGVAPHLPRRLELKPNNLCNLKCFTCNAYDSSQVEKELRELDNKFGGIKSFGGRLREIKVGTPGVWEGSVKEYQLPNMIGLDWAETGEFWNELINILPTLDVLSFAGGEPTVNPIVHKILKYCVDKDYAKNITVFISSNFTNLNKEFFSLMPAYKKFELIASIDGIGDVQEYTRFPSKWHVIEKNFKIARQYMQHPNVKILVNITVSILNIYYIIDLLEYLDAEFFNYPYYNEWPYNINLLNFPLELRIEWIPTELRAEIIDKIKSYQSKSDTLHFFPDLKIKTDLLIHELEKPYDPVQANFNLTILKNTITVIDSHRNVDHNKSIPFLNKIFLTGL
jgi:MoaA/NifB/PqqE/SkfB family radical SAM enzyme